MMRGLRNILAVVSLGQLLGIIQGGQAAIKVSSSPPVNASAPIPEAFVSYSIEFSSFPDFAGNKSLPNIFSNNLLNNLGRLTGTKPHIRVGGNTQDYALYNASLKTAINGTFNLQRSADYPTTIFIGPSYFESYSTWPNTRFSHGFNLGLGGNNSVGWETLLDTVPLACKALSNGKLLMWEYGNEPDLYSTSSQGPVRPPSWNESQYVSQWLNGTRAIKAQLTKYCPDMVSNESYGYLAPSFAGTNNHLKPLLTWQDGLDQDQDIKLISSHNYIGGATQPGVTLQGTLMNHTSTVHSISSQVNESNYLAYTGIPFILGETNSLYNEGAPGLSNSFGAALWGVDFNLWCASVGIRRVHMHQGTDYRYASWQPIETNKTIIGTKPPYYGNIAVAAMLGDLTSGSVQIANLPLESEFEAAYAAYVDEQLVRIAIINMREYNYTVNGTSSVLNPIPRPSHVYSFEVPGEGDVDVKTLYANGSDAISGITWDGWSYNWELKEGQAVKLHNVTTGERLKIARGVLNVTVEDSTAVILNF
ncbi:glycoside hydrolase family 79 protein [Hyaloscypha variabilis]